MRSLSHLSGSPRRGLVTLASTSATGIAREHVAPFALRSLGGLVGGARVFAADGRTSAVVNPSDGCEIARVPDLGASETRAAIVAAAGAAREWEGRGAGARARVLRDWGGLLRTNSRALGVLLCAEAGKPLAEAVGEIAYAADFFEWFAEEAKRPVGEVISPPQPGRRAHTQRGPVGVCAALTPWNFPAAMPARKLAASLAAGCTLVLRPSPETPLSALALAELGEDAGLPPGVLNVVLGVNHAETAAILTDSPLVRKISFTGSTRVGKIIAQQSAGTLKRISLELGGHAPFIVFHDAGEELKHEHTTAT